MTRAMTRAMTGAMTGPRHDLGRRALLRALGGGLLLAPLLGGAAAAKTLRLPGGGTIEVPLKSYAELRFENVVRQRYDISCGAAALATLLRHYYGRDVTEPELIESMLEAASEEDRVKIQRAGFSMLELKRAGERRGLLSAGFRIPEVENLVNLKVPAITLTTVRGYNHFVVLKGVSNGRVYIADPAFGNRQRTLDRFADEWGNVILVFLSEEQPGDPQFVTFADGVPAAADMVLPLHDLGLRLVRPLPGEF